MAILGATEWASEATTLAIRLEDLVDMAAMVVSEV